MLDPRTLRVEWAVLIVTLSLALVHLLKQVLLLQGWAEGMLITQGGRFGGYGFYVLKSKPAFLWNLVDLKRVRVPSV